MKRVKQIAGIGCALATAALLSMPAQAHNDSHKNRVGFSINLHTGNYDRHHTRHHKRGHHKHERRVYLAPRHYRYDRLAHRLDRRAHRAHRAYSRVCDHGYRYPVKRVQRAYRDAYLDRARRHHARHH